MRLVPITCFFPVLYDTCQEIQNRSRKSQVMGCRRHSRFMILISPLLSQVANYCPIFAGGVSSRNSAYRFLGIAIKLPPWKQILRLSSWEVVAPRTASLVGIWPDSATLFGLARPLLGLRDPFWAHVTLPGSSDPGRDCPSPEGVA